MGNPLSNKEEQAAITEISKLSNGARLWIGHHIRNALTPLILTCDCELPNHEKEKLLNKCLSHIVEDLNKIGC